MKIWIVLLRGVNVGGKNKLPMAEFRAALERAGFGDVKTYIQSGNIVLRTKEGQEAAATRVQDVLVKDFDIQTPVMALSVEELREAARNNPFGQDFEKPNWMFVTFLSDVPQSQDMGPIKALLTTNERCDLIGKVFYFYAGDGAGRSKAMSRIDAKLGVATTARNWNSVQKLIQMSGDL